MNSPCGANGVGLRLEKRFQGMEKLGGFPGRYCHTLHHSLKSRWRWRCHVAIIRESPSSTPSHVTPSGSETSVARAEDPPSSKSNCSSACRNFPGASSSNGVPGPRPGSFSYLQERRNRRVAFPRFGPPARQVSKIDWLSHTSRGGSMETGNADALTSTDRSAARSCRHSGQPLR